MDEGMERHSHYPHLSRWKQDDYIKWMIELPVEDWEALSEMFRYFGMSPVIGPVVAARYVRQHREHNGTNS